MSFSFVYILDYVSYYLRCEVGEVVNPFKDVSIGLLCRFYTIIPALTVMTIDSTWGNTMKLTKPRILSARDAIFFQLYNKHLELIA